MDSVPRGGLLEPGVRQRGGPLVGPGGGRPEVLGERAAGPVPRGDRLQDALQVLSGDLARVELDYVVLLSKVNLACSNCELQIADGLSGDFSVLTFRKSA